MVYLVAVQYKASAEKQNNVDIHPFAWLILSSLSQTAAYVWHY